jgi:hypothetical protein
VLSTGRSAVLDLDAFTHIIPRDDPVDPVNLTVNVDFTVVVDVGLEPDPSPRDVLPSHLGRDGQADAVPGEREADGAALLDIGVLLPP